MTDIGKKIYDRRKELNLTLEDVGNACGVGKSTVRKWENGMIKNMGRDKISKLASVLDINPVELVPMSPEVKTIEVKTLETPVRLYAKGSKPKSNDLFRRIAVQRATLDTNNILCVNNSPKVPSGAEVKMPEKSAKLLKVVGKLAKEDPESAVDLLKVLVERDLI